MKDQESQLMLESLDRSSPFTKDYLVKKSKSLSFLDFRANFLLFKIKKLGLPFVLKTKLNFAKRRSGYLNRLLYFLEKDNSLRLFQKSVFEHSILIAVF